MLNISHDLVSRILNDAGIHEHITSIGEPHAWVMQSQRIQLSSGRRLLLKAGVSEWTDAAAILSQVHAAGMLRDAGIPQPRVIAHAEHTETYGFRHILLEVQSGAQLRRLYPGADARGRINMYEAIGDAYRRIHAVTNDWAGVWDGVPDKSKYNIHPAAFYSGAEIQNGSNKHLLEHGVISRAVYDAICAAWARNVEYLVNRPSSLVHVSAFPWNIYLSGGGHYEVSGFNALGDFLWWDAMYDVSNILYPPFMDITDAERAAFMRRYGRPVEERALNLYRLFNRVLACADCFMAPVDREEGERWIRGKVREMDELLEVLR